MDVVITRHARRRLQLYSIDEADARAALERGMAGAERTGIRDTLVDEALAAKYRFPLKIVFDIKDDSVLVITAYPLKKGAKK